MHDMKNPIGINFQKLSKDINNLNTIQDAIACWLFEDFKNLYQLVMSYGDFIGYLKDSPQNSPINFSRILNCKSIPNETWFIPGTIIGTIYGHGVIVDIDEEHLLELKMTYL